MRNGSRFSSLLASPQTFFWLITRSTQGTSAEASRKKHRLITAHFQCALWTFRYFARDSRKDQKGLMEGEDLTLLEQTTHTRLRTTGYTLESSLKNLPRRLNLQNGSWLYYKALDIENTAFCLVVTHHPTVVSPKEHLYEQMASNPAYDKEKCTKNHRDWLFNSSTCFFVNLHVRSG